MKAIKVINQRKKKARNNIKNQATRIKIKKSGNQNESYKNQKKELYRF